MSRAGWKYESSRHSLAARGIKTRYYAKTVQTATDASIELAKMKKAKSEEVKLPPLPELVEPEVVIVTERGGNNRGRSQTAPETALRKAKAEEELKGLLEKRLREKVPTNKAIKDIAAGQFGNEYTIDGRQVSLQTLVQDPTLLNPTDREALKNALRVEAINATRRREVLAPVLQDVIAGDRTKVFGVERAGRTESEIKRIIQEQKRAEESPFKSEARQFGKNALVETADVVAETPGALFGVEKEGLRNINIGPEDKKFNGLIGTVSEAEHSPFFTTNAFIGNEEDHSLKPDLAGDSLSGSFDKLTGLGGVTKPKIPTHINRSKHEVEELYNAREDFAKVDVSGFERGDAAFKRGDREGVVRGISDLEAEQEKLKDRHLLMEQTRAEILNIRNRVSAYHESESGMFSNPLFGGGGGARDLADQTQKYNEVKAMVKQSNDRVVARKEILRRRLARLDATIPPEVGAPAHVRVFRDDSGDGGQVAYDLMHPGKVIEDIFKGGS